MKLRLLPLSAGLSLSAAAEALGISKTGCPRLRVKAAAMGLLE